jgi:hypothetical protein
MDIDQPNPSELDAGTLRQGDATDSNPKKRPIRLGLLQGKGWIADDFDAPLPEKLLAQFEGRAPNKP